MMPEQTKAIEEAKNLWVTLRELLNNPTPEVDSALKTIGVQECLAMLAACAKKRSQTRGLAIDAFILGVIINEQHQKLDNLYSDPKICEER